MICHLVKWSHLVELTWGLFYWTKNSKTSTNGTEISLSNFREIGKLINFRKTSQWTESSGKSNGTEIPAETFSEVWVKLARSCFLFRKCSTRHHSGNADLTCGDQFQIAETRVLIMEDMLVFLQEKDQKYSLLSLDQKVRDFFLCVSYSTLWFQSVGLSKLHLCSSFPRLRYSGLKRWLCGRLPPTRRPSFLWALVVKDPTSTR